MSIDPMEQQIHPSLKKIVSGYRIGLVALKLVMVLLGLMAVAALAYGAIGFLRGERGIWVISLIMVLFPLLAIPAFGLLFYHLSRREYPRILKADRLLRCTAPIKVRMRSTGLFCSTGLVVELLPHDGTGSGEKKMVAVVNPPRRGGMPRKEVSAALYREGNGPGDNLVVLWEGKPFIGSFSEPDSASKSSRKMIVALLGLMLLITAVAGGKAAMDYGKARHAALVLEQAVASEIWPKAEGRILSATLEKVRIPRGKGSVPGYKARLEYEFTVSDRPRTGNTIHLGYQPSKSEQAARALVEKYPMGSRVQIRYDASDPSWNAIEAGHVEECTVILKNARLAVLFMSGLACIILAIFLILAIKFQKSLRRLSPRDRIPHSIQPGR